MAAQLGGVAGNLLPESRFDTVPQFSQEAPLGAVSPRLVGDTCATLSLGEKGRTVANDGESKGQSFEGKSRSPEGDRPESGRRESNPRSQLGK